MKQGELYNWVFHYNHYTEKWSAIKRDYVGDLFSNRKSKHILSSSNINTLIELITRTDGNSAKIKDLLNKQIKHLIVE